MLYWLYKTLFVSQIGQIVNCHCNAIGQEANGLANPDLEYASTSNHFYNIHFLITITCNLPKNVYGSNVYYPITALLFMKYKSELMYPVLYFFLAHN